MEYNLGINIKAKIIAHLLKRTCRNIVDERLNT